MKTKKEKKEKKEVSFGSCKFAELQPPEKTVIQDQDVKCENYF